MAVPALVLLPGIDGTGRLFRRLERQLSGAFPIRSLAYSMERPEGYEELLEQVLRCIGDDPVLVLGESFSGPIAIEVAARRPGQVVGLILAATFVTSPLLPAVLRLGAAIGHSRLPQWLMRVFLIGPQHDPELAAEVEALTKALPRSVVARRLREVAVVDARPSLRQVRCPILVLHGSSDRLVRPAEARLTVKVQPGARLCYLPGPHTLLQCSTDAAASQIRQFHADCVAQAATR